MPKKAPDRSPNLREFVKENDQKLTDFCFYLLPGDVPHEELILDIFRSFGEHFQRNTRREAGANSAELRIQLFRIAWRFLKDALANPLAASPLEHDGRPEKLQDDDLLQLWGGDTKRFNQIVPLAVSRLHHLDPDFLAPVVLRDILGFEDGEVLRILGIRWGVYRHRLHRGRLEYRNALRGKPSEGSLAALPPGYPPSGSPEMPR